MKELEASIEKLDQVIANVTHLARSNKNLGDSVNESVRSAFRESASGLAALPASDMRDVAERTLARHEESWDSLFLAKRGQRATPSVAEPLHQTKRFLRDVIAAAAAHRPDDGNGIEQPLKKIAKGVRGVRNRLREIGKGLPVTLTKSSHGKEKKDQLLDAAAEEAEAIKHAQEEEGKVMAQKKPQVPDTLLWRKAEKP